jgi:hypothetical protein
MKTPHDDPGCFPRPELDGSFPKPEDGGSFPNAKGPRGDMKIPLPGAPKRVMPRILPYFPPYRP